MAITGTGTEQDPFIVHSYDEIVEVVTSHYGTGTTPYYSRLANDIDCNDYGVDWEWETIELASNASGKTHCDIIDLNGHTIKNAYIANSNYLFKGVNSSYSAEIKNGKTLNIFGNSPNGIFNSMRVTNISASMEFGHVSNNVISSCIVHNCALYAIILDMNNQSFIYFGANTDIKNVDIYLEAYKCNGSNCVALRPSGAFYCDSVRIIGKAVPASGSTYDFKICTNKMINSVIDFDMSAYVYPEGTTGTANIVGGTGDNTTVINTANINVSGYPRYTIPAGYLLATSTEQMKIGADLRSLGFLVVNVEE